NVSTFLPILLKDLRNALCSLHPITVIGTGKMHGANKFQHHTMSAETRSPPEMANVIRMTLKRHGIERPSKNTTGKVILARHKYPITLVVQSSPYWLRLTGKMAVFECFSPGFCRSLRTVSLESCPRSRIQKAVPLPSTDDDLSSSSVSS
ncbi:hypothetical protein PENTCL1PPCAC_13108, partial [Pristionchus entomophagus]